MKAWIMNIYWITSLENDKKAFTLVVVAIIGILAAVGAPIFQGFPEDSKKSASQQCHNDFADLVRVSTLRCESGAGHLSLVDMNGTQYKK
mgnify:FL=1